MFNNIILPEGNIGAPELLNKVGKRLFEDEWTLYEGCLEKELTTKKGQYIDILCPYWLLKLQCGVQGKIISHRYNKNIFKSAVKQTLNIFYEQRFEDHFDSEKVLAESEEIFGKEILYKTILKIQLNKSTEKNLKKILKSLISFILRYYVVKHYIESLVYSRRLVPLIRYKKSGKEERIPDEHLNIECDTKLSFNIPDSYGVFHKYKISSQGYEILEPCEGHLYFKEEEVNKFFAHLKTEQAYNLTERTSSTYLDLHKHGYLPDYVKIILDTIVELDITNDNQPKKSTILKHFEKYPEEMLTNHLRSVMVTIMRLPAKSNGGNTPLKKTKKKTAK
jgi:hypothetical protein